MTRKSYTVGMGSGHRYDPIEFEIVGTNLAGETIEPQVFTCLPVAQGSIQTDLAEAIASGDRALAGAQVMRTIRQSLVVGDVERFDALIHSRDVIVQAEVLRAIWEDLVTEYANRPTEPSSSLPAGPQTTPPISTDGSQWAQPPTSEVSVSNGSAMSSTA